MKKEFLIKTENIKLLNEIVRIIILIFFYIQSIILLENIDNYKFIYCPREKNKEADNLANQAKELENYQLIIHSQKFYNKINKFKDKNIDFKDLLY